MPAIKIGKFKINSDVQTEVQTKTQNIIHKHFGIKGKPQIDKDTGLPVVIKKNFWSNFLPKSMQKYTKTIFSSDGTRKLNESVFHGNYRIKHTVWDENGKILQLETYDPFEDIKVLKSLNKHGLYDVEKWQKGILRYEEYNGTFGRKLEKGEFEPYQYLLHIDEPQKVRTHKFYSADDELEKSEYYSKYTDAEGKEKQYLRFIVKDKNMAEFNPDGTMKSHIEYSKKLDEYKSYRKNPYWETLTQTDENGAVIGKLQYNCGELWRKQRTIPTENGHIEEMSDYVSLKAHCTKVVNNDGSYVETTRYYQDRLGGKLTQIKTKTPDGKMIFQTLRGGVETEYQKFSKNGHLMFEKKFDPQTKETLEKYFSFGYEKGENEFTSFPHTILERVNVTRNINGKEETRYFDGRYQRINPDGTKYKYSSEEERAAEWYKQEKETNYNTGENKNSSGAERVYKTSAGANETREEFIVRIRDFLSARGRKILNEQDLNNLAKVMGVDNPQLLTKFGDKTNSKAKILYRQLCKKYHPDTNNGDPVKQNLFIIVQNLRTLK